MADYLVIFTFVCTIFYKHYIKKDAKQSGDILFFYRF